MARSMDDKEARKYLAAFADGELDVDQTLSVLEHMAMNPQATRRVMHQQQLRQAVRRHVTEHTPSLDPAVRSRIEAMAREAPPEVAAWGSASTESEVQADADQPGVLARIGRWFPLAAAAVLLLAATLTWQASQNTVTPTGSPLFQAVVAERFSSRHESCAAEIRKLHGFDGTRGNIVSDLSQLPDELATYFHQDTAAVPSLDLSQLGYAFEGAGKCNLPGQGAAHLVYRPIDPSRNGPVSLWIKPYVGEPALDEGVVYRATPIDARRPIVIWRQSGMMYYLIGDTADEVEAVARMVRGQV